MDVFLGRFGEALGCQMIDFGSQNHQHITKMAPKIDPKSMKNRGCVADAFLERFGAALGAERAHCPGVWRTRLATIFVQKSENGIQKAIQKSIPKN